ncbi:hypothetical protein [Sphingobacterium multivorum]|uniref:DUF7946 domain-containing protein n=1 Tax=Sphingobacterium multivorum TaxID=28454 RepID=UPI0030167AA9
MNKEVKFILRYTGGNTDHHKINLYDAAISIQGISRALAISTNAFLNDGEVRTRVDKIKNVDFFLKPSRTGSFVENISIIFSDEVVSTLGAAGLITYFWDWIEFTWRIASGKEGADMPKKAFNKKIVSKNPKLKEKIKSSLKDPLLNLHKPISTENDIKIEIRRPSKGPIITFDKLSYDKIKSVEESEIVEDIIGNVTKYNHLTKYGRFYDDELESTVAFELKDKTDQELENIITTSLKESSINYKLGKIIMKGIVKQDRNGVIKRYQFTFGEEYDFI